MLTCVMIPSTLLFCYFRVLRHKRPVDKNGVGKLYKGMVDCFVKSAKNEGVASLWKGFMPNWGRLGPRGVICTS